jgi:hypothetical protein
MSIFVFANNASSVLASGIAATDTEITVQAGQGVLFPTISAGQLAPITLEDVNGNIEVVYATGRTGDTLVINRAEELTIALPFASGSRVEQRITMAVLQALLQKNGGDTLSGTTTLAGNLVLGSGGSIQNGEFTGSLRSQPGDTSNQIVVPIDSPATEGGSVILTTANFSDNLPSGLGLIISGMIVIWSGASTNIPAGWALCNGTTVGSTVTPDLRDKFIVGGGGTLDVTGNYGFTTDAASGGTPVVTGAALTVDNLPPHTHGNVIYAGGAGQVVGPAGTAAGSEYFYGGSGAGTRIDWQTDAGDGTSHPLTFSGVVLPGHTHTAESPPYIAMFFIIKL